ncbi:unnamed protein product [Knipowitschia caucasica]
MALPAAFLSEDQFSCSICLEIFNNPVSTPCGHSYCQVCISSYWDTSKTTSRASKMYQCPLCKESFSRRPELQINRTLKEITEHFKRAAASGPSGPPTETRRSPTPRRTKRAELPEGVIHEMVNRFHKNSTETDDPPPYTAIRRYTLSSAPEDPSLPLCPLHTRGLAFYCCQDHVCVCSVCAEKDHRGHSLSPAKREWQLRKSQLGIMDVELKDQITEREGKALEIRTALLDIKAAAELQTEEALGAFLSLISNVERCQADILEVIEMSRRSAEHQTQKQLKDLEEELKELRKRSAAVDQLSHADYVHMLESFPSLPPPPHTRDWSSASVDSALPSAVVLRNITQTVERFKDDLSKLTEVCE